MNRDQEIELLRDLQSLAIDCAEFAQGKITGEKMAFYCKNIADAVSKLLQEIPLNNDKATEKGTQ